MKEYLKSVGTQATAILIAAAGAAAFTFFQSVASSTGVCPEPAVSVTETGILGGVFKAAHSAFLFAKTHHLV